MDGAAEMVQLVNDGCAGMRTMVWTMCPAPKEESRLALLASTYTACKGEVKTRGLLGLAGQLNRQASGSVGERNSNTQRGGD